MTLATFFEKFELFADAPDAVEKMRELLRTLAVSGRLSDGPETSEWPTVRMKDVCVQITDGEHATPHRISNGVPLATAKNVRDGFLDLSNTDYVAKTTAEKCWKRCKPQHHDILMVCVGATTGRICLAQNPPDIVLVRSVALIRPKAERIAPSYLDLFLRSSTGQTQIWGNVKQSAQPCLYLGKMAEFEIVLPPLDEQKRIVAKVDELMALCDQLEAQQQERETRQAALARASLARFADAPTPANLSFLFHPSYPIPPADLRKSILTLAVQGKLVPQDPNDEPAEDSLSRNDEHRRKTARSDHRADEENQPLLSGDDRWDIADTWSWRGLADLVLFVDYRGKTPAKLSSGVRLLTAKNVRKGQINLSPEEFLSESEYNAWMTRGFPKAGDVLFTTEAPMGNAAVVGLTERFALAQRVICFQSYGALDPAFLVLQILSEQFQFILDKNGTGVTAKGIKASKLKQLPIATPPLAEQRRIVAKVEQLMALVDQLETQLATSRATAANLLSALVAELTAAPRASQPKPANIIDLHSRPEYIRAILAAEITDRMHKDRHFGQRKLQKVLHLAEHIGRLSEMGSRYQRYAAGPHDPELIADVEQKMQDSGWYAVELRDGGPGHLYRPLSQAGGHRTEFNRLWSAQAPIIHKLIDDMMTWDTNRCERFSTLYAAWNDLILQGEPVTDEAILREVLERWHPRKLETPRSKWIESLDWMRAHGYVPTGFGRATTPRAQGELL